MIPYSRQTIGRDDIRAVVKVLSSDWITQGPVVGRFEEALAKTVGARYSVSFANGTIALQAAFFAIGLGLGDQIVTSPLTFAATTNAALWFGARPVFADISWETGTINPREIERLITKKTRAIVAVDYAGHPADLDQLKGIAARHHITLIEDAAHALGARYKNRKIGSISDMTMFSFHPVKSITTGEGGAITTNRRDFYEKLLLFRNHGISRDPKKFRSRRDGPWYYEMQALGINGRLTDIQAALGISQLKKLPKFIAARRRIARRYTKELGGCGNILLPAERPAVRSSWHLYVIRLAGKIKNQRAGLFRFLQSRGVGAQVHYIPVHLHPYYRSLGYRPGLATRAEAWYRMALAIPIFPSLSFKHQSKVIALLKQYAEKN